MFSTLLSLVLTQGVDLQSIALSSDCRDHVPALRKAFLENDEASFRYLLVDVPAAGLHRGEVVLALPALTQLQPWRGLEAGEVRVANVNGDVRHVRPAMLSTKRPAKVFVPAQMPTVSTGVYAELCLAPADARDGLRDDLEHLAAERTVAQSCAEERLSKLDTTTAGANRYDLVTTRGGRVTNVQNYGDVLYGKAWKQCGGPRVEVLEKKVAQRIDDAWRVSWAPHRALVAKRFSEAPSGPAATAVVAPQDEAM